jgi:hypothetical protein
MKNFSFGKKSIFWWILQLLSIKTLKIRHNLGMLYDQNNTKNSESIRFNDISDDNNQQQQRLLLILLSVDVV